MDDKKVSMAEFQSALTNDKVRALQILQGMLTMGVFVFAAVVAGLFFTQQPPENPAPDGINVSMFLTWTHLVFAVTIYVLVAVVWPMIAFSSQKTAEADSGDKVIAILQQGMILRLAMLEGAALFGLVVCLLSVFNGSLYQQPLIWINLVSAAVMIAVSGATFPTRDRLQKIFETKFWPAR